VGDPACKSRRCRLHRRRADRGRHRGLGTVSRPERIEEANRGRQHPADLVAEDDAGVFAFVAWDDATGEILRLYTHPRGWGRGAGSALLARAVAALHAAGCRQAWLNTESRNERARHFYERYGWRLDGTARDRIWHGAHLHEPRYILDLSPEPVTP
jgi:ribosomal protein S18 acetylase RimI-like enzyme